MKIVILTAIWKRHKLFKIFLEGIERVKRNTEHEIVLVTIGSEKKAFSPNHIETNNFPLSTKWQSGLEYARGFTPDYVLMLGSDDFICSNLLDTYTPEMEKGTDLIGLLDCYFLDSRIDEFTHWIGYRNSRRGESIGMARMLSKGLLDKIGWEVWMQPANRGLDSIMMRKLNSIKYSKKMFNCKEENIMALDVKTAINVSNINTYRDLKVEPYNNLSKFVSKSEFYNILNLK
jgi:glycosyltransferase involved in cell wall biosynthesis